MLRGLAPPSCLLSIRKIQMKNVIRSFAIAAVLAGTLSTPAAAQLDAPTALRSNTAGFNLGVFLNGSAVQLEDSDVVESGGGGSLHLGYGFNPNISMFVRLNAAEIEAEEGGGTYTMAHFDLGARYSFGSSASALRPFVQGALNGRGFAVDMGGEDLEARGPGFTAGAGLEYFFSPRVALEAGLSYSFGEFNEGRIGGGEWVDFEDEAFEATSTRFDIGVSFHP